MPLSSREGDAKNALLSTVAKVGGDSFYEVTERTQIDPGSILV
jgi:hypothetical protein